ncbi:hypothetical protein M9458_017383, partial [Cirrhinus mrigala]
RERCWEICLRCPPFVGRITNSTKGSLSMRISCSPITFLRPPHHVDTRRLLPSSSWLRDWI